MYNKEPSYNNTKHEIQQKKNKMLSKKKSNYKSPIFNL